MFTTLFQSASGKSRRSISLQVETLEGRDMPSTLPVSLNPTPFVDWPPPPTMAYQVIGEKSEPSHSVHESAIWPPPPPSALGAGTGYEVMISRASGEEIPQ